MWNDAQFAHEKNAVLRLNLEVSSQSYNYFDMAILLFIIYGSYICVEHPRCTVRDEFEPIDDTFQ